LFWFGVLIIRTSFSRQLIVHLNFIAMHLRKITLFLVNGIIAVCARQKANPVFIFIKQDNSTAKVPYYLI